MAELHRSLRVAACYCIWPDRQDALGREHVLKAGLREWLALEGAGLLDLPSLPAFHRSSRPASPLLARQALGSPWDCRPCMYPKAQASQTRARQARRGILHMQI